MVQTSVGVLQTCAGEELGLLKKKKIVIRSLGVYGQA